jgi:hypothetical protein
MTFSTYCDQAIGIDSIFITIKVSKHCYFIKTCSPKHILHLLTGV